MATTLVALKGTLGSTDYYVLSMKAKDIADKAVIPAEMEGWKAMTLDERFQRDINYKRVKSQIAPYIAQDEDRFFGAFVMTAQNFDPSNFEPLTDVASKDLPKLYKTEATKIGFLTLDGGEVLIPLDGQHRLKAIEFAIAGKDERGRDIDSIHPNSDVASDDVVVILIPYDNEKSRKIFTKINRYAKPTTTGTNLVTDDDDIIAVLSRKVANELIGADLVNFETNTLSKTAREFTTLATIAECNVTMLSCFPGRIPRTEPIADQVQRSLYESKVMEYWEFLLHEIDWFAKALEDKSAGGDKRRIEIRANYLLGKPVPQWCLVQAFVHLVDNEFNTRKYSEAANNLNKIDWKIHDNPLWQGVLLGSNNQIFTKNRNIAARIIAYMAGEQLDEAAKSELLEGYRKLFAPEERSGKDLPQRV